MQFLPLGCRSVREAYTLPCDSPYSRFILAADSDERRSTHGHEVPRRDLFVFPSCALVSLVVQVLIFILRPEHSSSWRQEQRGAELPVYHEEMNLPVNPPVLPMLAKRVDELPPGEEWIFEPKWDGFRALVFRDGDEVFIQSRDEKPLNRYFPELIEPLQATLPTRCVLDGEIVIVKDNELDFDLLQLRLHPAASRVKMLSQRTPASLVFFDVLCEGDVDLRTR